MLKRAPMLRENVIFRAQIKNCFREPRERKKRVIIFEYFCNFLLDVFFCHGSEINYAVEGLLIVNTTSVNKFASMKSEKLGRSFFVSISAFVFLTLIRHELIIIGLKGCLEV